MLNKSHVYPRRRVLLDCGTELITKQSHKDECDIYRILNQYQRTGILTHVQSARATYEDLPDPIDYQTSLHIIMESEQAFQALPAKVRAHFDNDPGAFLASFADPKQHDTLREFGFLKPLEAVQEALSDPPATSLPG